jgi:hypothetical protein
MGHGAMGIGIRDIQYNSVEVLMSAEVSVGSFSMGILD